MAIKKSHAARSALLPHDQFRAARSYEAKRQVLLDPRMTRQGLLSVADEITSAPMKESQQLLNAVFENPNALSWTMTEDDEAQDIVFLACVQLSQIVSQAFWSTISDDQRLLASFGFFCNEWICMAHKDDRRGMFDDAIIDITLEKMKGWDRKDRPRVFIRKFAFFIRNPFRSPPDRLRGAQMFFRRMQEESPSLFYKHWMDPPPSFVLLRGLSTEIVLGLHL